MEEKCWKCKSWGISFASSGQATTDEMIWVCRHCGYEETYQMRRRRRLPRALLGLVIVAVALALVAVVMALGGYYTIRDWSLKWRELAFALIVCGVLVSAFLVFGWGVRQLENGGFRQLLIDLGIRPKRDTKF